LQNAPWHIRAAEVLFGRLLRRALSIAEAASAIQRHDETIAEYHLLYGQSGAQAGHSTIESLAENQSTLHVARYSLPKV